MPPKKPFAGVTLVATFISPGVAAGAAGFMIVGGKIIKIGPRGPALKQLAATVAALSGKKLKSPARQRA